MLVCVRCVCMHTSCISCAPVCLVYQALHPRKVTREPYSGPVVGTVRSEAVRNASD